MLAEVGGGGFGEDQSAAGGGGDEAVFDQARQDQLLLFSSEVTADFLAALEPA